MKNREKQIELLEKELDSSLKYTINPFDEIDCDVMHLYKIYVELLEYQKMVYGEYIRYGLDINDFMDIEKRIKKLK
jgi:hypothetical protein